MSLQGSLKGLLQNETPVVKPERVQDNRWRIRDIVTSSPTAQETRRRIRGIVTAPAAAAATCCEQGEHQ